MKIKHIIACASLLVLSACTGGHFISDKSEREEVHNDFRQRRAEIGNDQMFSVFDSELTAAEREALEFLYAYMPLADIANQDSDYFLENVRCSFTAREEMPWGEKVPEREFRHFVLPVRVNNEDLDGHRPIFYNELKDRVKGLSMYDAILEVNHWCHEHVVYRPTDARTSSPLATMRNAYGRCGEESTFTVAALRSVGIPARQVYTPRWAHTDNNHAWVEAWADGKWYFLGACEPEPVLDLAWFNAPASRGMLMHTKVFGKYHGPEDVMSRTARYTEINVIDNYAKSARADISVVDENGRPIPGATVEFKLYNYAEFYTVATKSTDETGHTSLSAGLGDMIVWVTHNGKFGFAKVTFGKDKEVTVVVDKTPGTNATYEIEIVPPAEPANIPAVTDAQRAENNRRLAIEDSIRGAYEATFPSEADAKNFCAKNGYRYDTDLYKAIIESRGNHETIMDFLAKYAGSTDDRRYAEAIITTTFRNYPKDLHDISAEVLDNKMADVRAANEGVQNGMVNNPWMRISNEMLTPYSAYFHDVIDSATRAALTGNEAALIQWVKDSIRVVDDCNLGGSPISPEGVWRTRMADPHSRDIFFVALAHSLGRPAEIDPVTGKVKIYRFHELNTDTMSREELVYELRKMFKGYEVNFDETSNSEAKATPVGELKMTYTPTAVLPNPKYYSHFSLSSIDAGGRLHLLEYPEPDVTADGITFSDFKYGKRIDAGNYLLVTGTRMAGGNVLATMTFFSVKSDETVEIPLTMRTDDEDIQVIGDFNSEGLYLPLTDVESDAGDATSVLSTTGRGYFVIGILGAGEEPTNHALKDIAAMSKELEQWGRPMILLFPYDDSRSRFKPEEFPGLPQTVSFGIDRNDAFRREIIKNLNLNENAPLPLFIIADTFNRVVYVSQGYTIGLGEQLHRVITKL